MPTISPRRRFSFALVGAVVALSALAVPTAATAADACVASTTPTTATQPWADFASSPNQYAVMEPAYKAYFLSLSTFSSGIEVDTTQVEFDTLNDTMLDDSNAAQASVSAAGVTIVNQIAALKAALLVADPANQVANEAVIDNFGSSISGSPYGTALNDLFIDYLSQFGAYLTDVQTAITAATPVPTEPSTLADAYAALAGAVDGIGAYIGAAVYGEAATHIVYGCAAALAATGSGDPTQGVGVAGVVLLAGAIFLIAARRQREALEI